MSNPPETETEQPMTAPEANPSTPVEDTGMPEWMAKRIQIARAYRLHADESANREWNYETHTTIRSLADDRERLQEHLRAVQGCVKNWQDSAVSLRAQLEKTWEEIGRLGEIVMDQSSDRERLLAENAAFRQREMDHENAEASVCPEDVGFVEHIRSLQAALTAAEGEREETYSAYADAAAVVDKAALETLRIAYVGCGKIVGVNYGAIGARCGEICTGRRSLCFRCATNRDAAIDRLLGTTDNGGVDG